MIERQYRVMIGEREVYVFGIGMAEPPPAEIFANKGFGERATKRRLPARDWSAVRASWARGKFPVRGISGWHLE